MSTATVSSAIKDANRNTPFSKRFKSQWWRHLLGIIAVVFAAFPLVYVLSASLAPGGTLTGSNKLFWRLRVLIRASVPLPTSPQVVKTSVFRFLPNK